MSLKEDLATLTSGAVISDPTSLAPYSRDASIFKVTPELVVQVKTSDEISALVKYVTNKPKTNLSLTVRSGGTCMSGGPLTDSVVVDVGKHLNKILEVGNEEATVEPGAFYRDFERATLERNLLLPCYPASREICTVGGMVNNNAGGEKTLSYGKTDRYLKQLKVILSNGREYILRPLSLSELEKKKELDTFEGEIYRKMYKLLDKNYDKIQAARPAVTKNSTGYSLWNVWDKKTFDLTQLFAGSQGTLGITTEITFRLVKPRPQAAMLVIFLPKLNNLAKIVTQVLRYSPESFESYDKHTLKLALKFAHRLFGRQGSLLKLLVQFLPEIKLVLTGGLPELVLLAEFTGHNQAEVIGRARAAQAALKESGVRTRLATRRQEINKYWTIRRESFNLLRGKIGHEHTTPFIDDFIVPPATLTEFLPKLDDILSQYEIFYTIAGHAGDANFHIIPLMDLSDPAQRAIIPELAKKVYDLVFEFKGSMSGEHNDGLIRSTFLEQMYGPEIYQLFVDTKKIFDPNNIFNPRKKVGASWDYSRTHIATD